MRMTQNFIIGLLALLALAAISMAAVAAFSAPFVMVFNDHKAIQAAGGTILAIMVFNGLSYVGTKVRRYL